MKKMLVMVGLLSVLAVIAPYSVQAAVFLPHNPISTVDPVNDDSVYVGSYEEIDNPDFGHRLTPPHGNSVVPEPASIALLASGLLGLAGLKKRKI